MTGGGLRGGEEARQNQSLQSFLPSFPPSRLPLFCSSNNVTVLYRSPNMARLHRPERRGAFHLHLAVLAPPLLLPVNLLSINLFSDKETDRKRKDRWCREPTPFRSLISNYSIYINVSRYLEHSKEQTISPTHPSFLRWACWDQLESAADQ